MSHRRGIWGWLFAAVVLMALTIPSPAGAQTPTGGTPTAVAGDLTPVPMLAYYYIWFDPSSWNRAKQDYPTLGKYSSSDPQVMRQHIQWAKAAGLQGFIVSWKDTKVLTLRLKQLMDIADQENFKLMVIYEGLDFSRNPQPVDKVAADFDTFIADFAGDKAFNLYGKPVVIWSGTWQYTPEQVSQVTQARRDKLLILASEKNVPGYQRLAAYVDGDAYYWSSVNPDTNSGYADKLSNMADAIHAKHGLWIAPAAAGFDARQVGGTTVVARNNGDTLRQEVNTAVGSSPDAVGIISWNEFSENSHIEPSQQNGSRYLDVLAQINHVPAPAAPSDSSDPAVGAVPELAGGKWIAIIAMAAVSLGSLAILIWRQIGHRS